MVMQSAEEGARTEGSTECLCIRVNTLGKPNDLSNKEPFQDRID